MLNSELGVIDIILKATDSKSGILGLKCHKDLKAMNDGSYPSLKSLVTSYYQQCLVISPLVHVKYKHKSILFF